MSNSVTVMPTKFTNLDGSGETRGVRVYDSYGQKYDNTWESVPTDDLEILALVIENRSAPEIMGYVEQEQGGVTIGSEFYEWDQIKHLFE
jgi:hypothetical protein